VLDLLGNSGERAAPNRGLLPELRPLVCPVRVRPVGCALLDLDEAPETDVADDDVHGAAARVDERDLDAVAERGPRGQRRGGRDEAAQDEGQRRGPDGDGARGVEPALGLVEAAVQGVDVGDVGQRRAGGRVSELSPRRRRHAIPRVPVHVLLRVHHHGLGLAGLRFPKLYRAISNGSRDPFFLGLEKIHCRLRFGLEERGGGREETAVEENVWWWRPSPVRAVAPSRPVVDWCRPWRRGNDRVMVTRNKWSVSHLRFEFESGMIFIFFTFILFEKMSACFVVCR
jgi:hypothetical protein